ncbi:MAG TPA: sialidase family protein [Polyangia bacterium]|jgi:hypothetical protein
MSPRSALALRILAAIVALAAGGGCTSSTPAGAADAGPLEDAAGEAAAPPDAAPDLAPVVVDLGMISEQHQYGEHEPSVAATPDGRVAVAWLVAFAAKYQINYRISTDDGVSFGVEQTIPMPTDTNICANTSLAADAAGAIHLAYACETVSAGGVRSNVQVLAARSPAGSTTFGDGVVVTDPAATPFAYDQPRIAATSTGGLLVTYSHFSTTDSRQIAASSDDGLQWTRTAISPGIAIDENIGRIYASPTDARVWVAMLLDGNRGVRLCRSDDGGRTWPAANQRNVDEPAGTMFSLDLAIAGHGEEIWVLYGLTDEVPSRQSQMKLNRLHLVRSGDGGATLEAPVSIDPEAGEYLMLPNLVHDDGGGLDITYYAGSAASDPAASYRRRRSTDGGKSFTSSIVLHQPLVFDTSRVTTRWLGDYEGLAAAAGKLYIAYTDSTAPAAHVAFLRTSVP